MKYLRHDGEKTIKDLRNLSRLKELNYIAIKDIKIQEIFLDY